MADIPTVQADILPSTSTVQFANVGVLVKGKVTKQELLSVWDRVQYVSQRSPWYVGDLLNLMEDTFADGEEMQYVNETLGLQTIRNYKSVCRRIPLEIRQSPEELSFTAHSRFAPLPTLELRAWWINLAVERCWNSEDCRKAYSLIQPYINRDLDGDEPTPDVIDEDMIFSQVEKEPLTFEVGEEPAQSIPEAVHPGKMPDVWEVLMSMTELRVADEALQAAIEGEAFQDQPALRGALEGIALEVSLAYKQAVAEVNAYTAKLADYERGA